MPVEFRAQGLKSLIPEALTLVFNVREARDRDLAPHTIPMAASLRQRCDTNLAALGANDLRP